MTKGRGRKDSMDREVLVAVKEMGTDFAFLGETLNLTLSELT